MLTDLSMIFKSIDSKSQMSCKQGGLGQRERPKTLLMMDSFETTGRSVGIQTAVRRKSKIDGATGDGYVICMT